MRTGQEMPGFIFLSATRKLKAGVVFTLCACLLAASSGAAAQARYDLIGGDGVASVEGLRIYTIRDNRMAVCYTLFVLGSGDGVSSRTTREPGLTADDYQKLQTARTLKEAAAVRDQKFAALRAWSATGWSVEKDAEHGRIQDEYEAVVRSVLPTVYPPGQISPAFRTTTTAELNQAVRQAIADADAVTAAVSRAGTDDQLMQMVNRIAQSPRLAVAGPVACGAAPAPAR